MCLCACFLVLSEAMSRVRAAADMHEIRPGLWLGSVEAASNHKALQARGITHVLTLGEGLGEYMGVQGTGPESTWVAQRKRLGPSASDPFERLMVSILDGPDEPLNRHFEPCSAFISEAMSKGHKGGVLVHCHAGISRGASTVAQHLMRTEGLTAAQSLASIRSAGRTFIDPNEGFLRQLRQLEGELQHRQPEVRQFDRNKQKCEAALSYCVGPSPFLQEREQEFASRLDAMRSRLKGLHDNGRCQATMRASRSVSPPRSARFSDEISDRLNFPAARGDSIYACKGLLADPADVFRPYFMEDRLLAERLGRTPCKNYPLAQDFIPLIQQDMSRDLFFDSALRNSPAMEDRLWRRSAWKYAGQSLMGR